MGKHSDNATVTRLIDKSREAFIMAIEIYNKPTIRYRLEGFSFFICNAWELMLKAFIIERDGEQAVYYPNKPYRTLSLGDCISRVFTNSKAPLRLNLEKIIDLRNTSTHFIIEEYEMLYVPLLQACVFNFIEKMREFHGEDLTEIIPENFITLSTRITMEDEPAIRAKYPNQIAEKLIALQHTIKPMIADNNSGFAIRIEHKYYQTKKRGEATEFYHIDRDAEEPVRIINVAKDPNETHKYPARKAIKEICKRLEREEIRPMYQGKLISFNSHWFDLFIKFYDLKTDEAYCYVDRHYSQPQYSYSMKAVDFIVEEIRKAPNRILDDLKKKSPRKNT